MLPFLKEMKKKDYQKMTIALNEWKEYFTG